jgi:AcrR family transcriptional regulator
MTATAPRSRRRKDGAATRQRILDAAVECILDKGYYQASSNEIARTAGVTWGALQHQFGSRQALLLEVLEDRWGKLLEQVASAKIDGATLEERLQSVLDVLASHYEQPEHLVQLQILLDLSRDPDSSKEVRRATKRYGAELTHAWEPLFAQALGDASGETDLVVYAFTTLRAYLQARLIASSIADTASDSVSRTLLVRGVAAAIREAADERGIPLP